MSDDAQGLEEVFKIVAERDRLRAVNTELLALLEELIDIEGPCPGTAQWAEKVRAVIAKAKG